MWMVFQNIILYCTHLSSCYDVRWWNAYVKRWSGGRTQALWHRVRLLLTIWSLFPYCCWLWVTETTESETRDQGGLLYIISLLWTFQFLITFSRNPQDSCYHLRGPAGGGLWRTFQPHLTILICSHLRPLALPFPLPRRQVFMIDLWMICPSFIQASAQISLQIHLSVLYKISYIFHFT